MTVVQGRVWVEVGRVLIRTTHARSVLASAIVCVGIRREVASVGVGATEHQAAAVFASAVHLGFRIEVAGFFVHASHLGTESSVLVEVDARLIGAVVAGQFVRAAIFSWRHAKQAAEVTRTWQVEVRRRIVVASKRQRTSTHLNDAGSVVVRGKR